MADETVSVLIQLLVDAQAAAQSLNTVKGVEKGIDDVRSKGRGAFQNIGADIKAATSALGGFASEAVKVVGQVAKATAAAAGAVIGTGVAAASAYAQDRKGFEQGANDMLRAQKEVQAAFVDLGRVTARVATPALEFFAEGIEVVADLLDKLIPEGSQEAVKKFFDEAIPNAILRFEQLIGIVQGFGALIERDAGNTIDGFITNVQKIAVDIGAFIEKLKTGFTDFLHDLKIGFTNLINGLIDGINSALSHLPGSPQIGHIQGAEAGRMEAGARDRTSASVQKQELEDALAGRVAGRNQKAADTGAEIAERDKQTVEFLGEMKTTFHRAKAQLEDDLNSSREFVMDYMQYKKAVQASDKQYAADKAKLTDDYNKAELKATQDHAREVADFEREQQQAERDLTANYYDERDKAARDFAANEAQIEKQAQLKRLQDLRAHEFRLSEFAMRRDVAGFVAEQQSFKLQTEAEDEQKALEKQQRAEAFASANEERDRQYAKELGDLKRQGAEKRQQMEEQYRREQSDRAQAYREQLSLLAQKHDAERQSLLTHFAEQLADLQGNIAGLQGIQIAGYNQALVDAQNFANQYGATLREAYSASLGVGSSSAPAQLPAGIDWSQFQGAQQPVSSSTQDFLANALGLPSFADGGTMLWDGLARLHRGEVITNPAKGQRASGVNVTVNVVNPIGADNIVESATNGALQGVIQAKKIAALSIGAVAS